MLGLLTLFNRRGVLTTFKEKEWLDYECGNGIARQTLQNSKENEQVVYIILSRFALLKPRASVKERK